jgi:cholesterol oxidase
MSAADYDAVVVGSGFGGSVTAYRYQEAGKRVLVLERGREYGPGDDQANFPRSPREFHATFWKPDSKLYGMFEVWTFRRIEAMVSAALGGGSIIYANVLLEKPASTFEGWPLTHDDLVSHYCAVRKIIAPQEYPFGHAPYNATAKTMAFAKAGATLPPLAVTFANEGRPPVPGEPIVGQPGRYTCRLCGECNIGCKYGSKNTLDFNYLRLFRDHGGEIKTLAEVTRFTKEDGQFAVDYTKYDPDADTHEELTVTANRLVLSAGSLGSTYLLLANRENLGRPLNPKTVGTRWCGNGDLLGFLNTTKGAFDPETGPVITSLLTYEDGEHYHVIEDGGYPAFLEWFIEGTHSIGMVRRAIRFGMTLAKNWMLDRPVSNISADMAALVGDGKKESRALPLCGMGDDKPDGNLTLTKKGWLENDWSMKSSEEFYAAITKSMEDLATKLDAQFTPEALWIFKRLITVHPVGGCPMGTTAEDGVVNQYGEVFNVGGLSIVDGSILPGPVGPNPSLTIAAIADRAATHTLAHW